MAVTDFVASAPSYVADFRLRPDSPALKLGFRPIVSGTVSGTGYAGPKLPR